MKKKYNFKKIDLNEIANYSIWPSRLLNITPWENKNRTKKNIKIEYDKKNKDLLKIIKKKKLFKNNLSKTLAALNKNFFNNEHFFHINEELYFSKDTSFFWKKIYKVLIDEINKYTTKYKNETVVELGSGWGRNLLYLINHKVIQRGIGLDRNVAGLVVSKKISKKFKLDLDFFKFDYYKPYLNRQHIQNNIVFTHNSVEQLNYISEKIIKDLSKSKPRVVIHLEPIYEHRQNQSILHFLWKRYTQVNDYNRNLLTVLKKLDKDKIIKILKIKKNVVGLHALNPCSIVVWRPV